MENAETILVVILSVFLALFLLLGIILLVKLIKLADQAKQLIDKTEGLIDKAESVVETAGSVGEFFQRASGTFALSKLVSRFANIVMNRQDRPKGRKGN